MLSEIFFFSSRDLNYLQYKLSKLAVNICKIHQHPRGLWKVWSSRYIQQC